MAQNVVGSVLDLVFSGSYSKVQNRGVGFHDDLNLPESPAKLHPGGMGQQDHRFVDMPDIVRSQDRLVGLQETNRVSSRDVGVVHDDEL
jgi:hypothetical protein